MGGSVTDANQVQKAIGCFLSSTIEGFELIVGERVASALDVDDEERPSCSGSTSALISRS
jgi:hypothetical protein